MSGDKIEGSNNQQKFRLALRPGERIFKYFSFQKSHASAAEIIEQDKEFYPIDNPPAPKPDLIPTLLAAMQTVLFIGGPAGIIASAGVGLLYGAFVAEAPKNWQADLAKSIQIAVGKATSDAEVAKAKISLTEFSKWVLGKEELFKSEDPNDLEIFAIHQNMARYYRSRGHWAEYNKNVKSFQLAFDEMCSIISADIREIRSKIELLKNNRRISVGGMQTQSESIYSHDKTELIGLIIGSVTKEWKRWYVHDSTSGRDITLAEHAARLFSSDADDGAENQLKVYKKNLDDHINRHYTEWPPFPEGIEKIITKSTVHLQPSTPENPPLVNGTFSRPDDIPAGIEILYRYAMRTAAAGNDARFGEPSPWTDWLSVPDKSRFPALLIGDCYCPFKTVRRIWYRTRTRKTSAEEEAQLSVYATEPDLVGYGVPEWPLQELSAIII
ncbi:hypothetical protein K440DRAFT_641941 [Wilcoxina mikolae CBS 423.85]|nr:hypothetical protein K440DRAFT_641941 [Wilcoxina mikolae CBS 423.85]